MLPKLIVVLVVLALGGMYVVYAAGLSQQAPRGGCCGMGGMAQDAAKPAKEGTAVPAKEAGCGGCAMMGKEAEAESSALVTTVTTRPTTAPSSAANANSTAVYSCPMHPEVVSSKPGKCPKCGMSLVAKQQNSKGDQKPADKGNAGDSSTSHTHNH